MYDPDQQKDRRETQGSEANKYTGPGHGPQGVDKAPGEEESTDNVQFTQQTQKGKKNDADLDDPKDDPVDEDI